MLLNIGNQIFTTADARFELKPAASSSPMSLATLTGYAATWNTLSDDRGGYFVRLKPGSARFSGSTDALWNHNRDFPIGSAGNGSLRLRNDSRGLAFAIDLPDTQFGRDTFRLVKDRYVRGMSFRWTNPQGRPIRENSGTVFEADAFDVEEVSIVSNPSFTGTAVNVSVPAGAARYSARIQQRHQLDRLRFQSLTLAPMPRR